MKHRRAGGARAMAKAPRIAAVDALRGGAIVLMFGYHFCFDLRFHHVLAADFEHDPFWLGFRAVIVTAFMALVGVSLVLAEEARTPAALRWRRIGTIAACAAAASAGSYLLFPQTFITFGILHCIAVTSILAWPLARSPRAALALGVLVIGAGLAWSHPAFDASWLAWAGFVTHKPATEDYVPLAPWAGVTCLGIALGHALVRDRFRRLAPLAASPRWLRFLGRHSLVVYMLHQPLFLGVLWLFLGS